jgi:hypothetical protein
MFVGYVQLKPYAQMMPSRDAAPCIGENASTFAPGAGFGQNVIKPEAPAGNTGETAPATRRGSSWSACRSRSRSRGAIEHQ